MSEIVPMDFFKYVVLVDGDFRSNINLANVFKVDDNRC